MTLDINVQRLATRNRTLAQELHLSVPGGVIHTIMGTSGSGKSSLLAAVCGTTCFLRFLRVGRLSVRNG